MGRRDGPGQVQIDLLGTRPARVTGVVASLGAFALVVGDLLFISPASGDSVVVARAQVPTVQLYVSGVLGVAAVWLYAVGAWHVLFGLGPLRRGVQLVVGTSLTAMVIGTGIYHVGFPALMFGAQVAVIEGADRTAELALALPETYARLLLGLAVIVPGTAFTLAFTWLVAAGRTDYPRWFALMNPIVLLTLLWLIETAVGFTGVDVSFSAYYGALINVAFVLFFTTSTWLLWDSRSSDREEGT